MKALHPGRDESECEARHSPANCGIRPATICRDERAEKKERARQIGDNPDVELACNEENDEREERELRDCEAANEGGLAPTESKNRADVPRGEAGHENRYECGRPQN